jgi:hypothetical protein
MENLKKRRKLLSFVIIVLCGLMVFKMRTALESISILLFMLIFATGVATGALIVVMRMMREQAHEKKE